MRRTALAILLLLAAGCGRGDIVVVGDLAEVTSLKAIPDRDLDLLFVIDNSGSMADDQASLAANFPRMIDALGRLDQGLPDLHVGVVTSDLGATGRWDPAHPATGVPGCDGAGDDGLLVQGAGVTGRYLEDLANDDGTRATNFTGSLRDAFAQLASVGDTGCGFEQHLHAMRRALEGDRNPGFLRAGANLAIVILADEDDCSVGDPAFFGPDIATLGPLQSFRCFRFGVQCAPDDPTATGAKADCAPRAPAQLVDDVSSYVDFLTQLKGDPRQIMVAGIVGDPAPVAVELAAPGGSPAQPTLAHSCTYTAPDGSVQTADPAVRLAAFLDAFPGRSTLTSICNPDLSGALDDIAASARRLMGDPCIDTGALADTAPEPGVQPACEVVDVRDAAPDAPAALPPCGAGEGDCYELVADPVACPGSADHLRVKIQRAAPPAADTWTHVRCEPAAP